MSSVRPAYINVYQRILTDNNYRDANFPDAEIVRSEECGGHGPRAGPGGVQEQRHFRGPGEICHCISDVIEQIYRKYCKK